MPRLRYSKVCGGLVYFAVGLAICELFILNMVLLYAYLSIHDQISGFLSASENAPLIDKLLNVPTLRDIAYEAKNGGYVSLLENTLGRIFFVAEKSSHNRNGSSRFQSSEISYVTFDVSRSGEALYLIRRLKQRDDDFFKRYEQLVIDIGANDGLLSSNSFNLIQMGWDAILVEPQMSLLQLAKANINKYSDPFREGKQYVRLVNAAIGPKDGTADFVLKGDDMESHILRTVPDRRDQGAQLVVQVPCMTVASFTTMYRVPSRFALLSIDAEGVGDMILHQWIQEGFRPAYIVFEFIYNTKSAVQVTDYLEHHGYLLLIKLGFNLIFEHQDGQA